MPKYNEIGANTNNSNVQSTSSHETALSVSKFDIRELIDLAKDLKGEEALTDYYSFFSNPKDTFSGEETLKSLMRFYANVRYLTQEINRIFNNL